MLLTLWKADVTNRDIQKFTHWGADVICATSIQKFTKNSNSPIVILFCTLYCMHKHLSDVSNRHWLLLVWAWVLSAILTAVVWCEVVSAHLDAHFLPILCFVFMVLEIIIYFVCTYFFFKLFCSKYLQIIAKKSGIEPKMKAEVSNYCKPN